MMTPHVWVRGIVDRLRHFADRDYQRDVWLAHKGQWFESYAESMCALFDDFDFDTLIDRSWNVVGLSQRNRDCLAEFRDLLNQAEARAKQSTSQAPDAQLAAMLRDSQWGQVVAAAHAAIRELRAWLDEHPELTV